MNRLAHIISFVFSPLLVPTYAVWLVLATSVLSYTPLSTRVGVTLASFLLTCIFPLIAIGVMWKIGYISEPGLNKRTERTVPYVITALSYVACGIYLWRVNAPMWFVMFIGGALLATIISIVVNRWWKISAHMAAMGGLLAILVRIAISGLAVTPMLWIIILAIVACGAVATARLILERHTLGQVTAGFLNGFLCVIILSFLF